MAERKRRKKRDGSISVNSNSNSNNNSNSKRRIWELRSTTVCRILGVSLDENEIRKIFLELKLNHRNQSPTAYEIIQHLAELCTSRNQYAKSVEKLLEKQFTPHRKGVGTLDPQEICAFLDRGNCGVSAENSLKLKDSPLAALIWFAARNAGSDKEIESTLSAVLQMRELQALRVYDALSRKLPPGGNVETIIDGLRRATESNEKWQQKYARLEQKKDELISERESVKEEKSRFIHELEEQKRLNVRLQRRLNDFGGETAYEQIDTQKKELTVLREELKELKKEQTRLVRLTMSMSAPTPMSMSMSRVEEKSVDAVCSCSGTCNSSSSDNENCSEEPQLNGLRIAYVGGVESLEQSYKELAETLGCQFTYHCGHCERGKNAIASIIDRNDVIFCPVDINSHNACRLVKQVCKSRGKPCCFLRSSGLSALKKGLLNFAAGSVFKVRNVR